MDKAERRRVALDHVIRESDRLRAEFERGMQRSGEMDVQTAFNNISTMLGHVASRLLYLETAVRILADPDSDPAEMFPGEDEAKNE